MNSTMCVHKDENRKVKGAKQAGDYACLRNPTFRENFNVSRSVLLKKKEDIFCDSRFEEGNINSTLFVPILFPLFLSPCHVNP